MDAATFYALAAWMLVALVANAFLHSAKRRHRAFSLAFEEIMTPQEITLHVDSHYSVAGAAKAADGTDLPLASLVLLGGDGVGTIVDSDASDDISEFDTASSAGATGQVSATAVGADGKHYEALANITLAAKDEVIEPFALTFTEVTV